MSLKRIKPLLFVMIATAIAPAVMAQTDIKQQVARQFLLAAPNSDGYLALEKHFPKDAQRFVNTLARTTQGTTSKTIARRIQRVGTRIRKKNARYIWTAPATNLLQVTRFYRDGLVYLENDTAACNRFYMGGITALAPATRARFEKTSIGQQSLVGLEALAAGRDTPVRRGKARAKDYAAFAAEMIRMGMTEADFFVIENPDVEDPRLCRAAIKMMRTLYASDIASIHRVRASVFYYSMKE